MRVQNFLIKEKGKLIPASATDFRVEDFHVVKGGINQTCFLGVTYVDGGKKALLDLVLKSYPNSEEERKKALREYELLSFLSKSGFPVPRPYFCDPTCGIFSRPCILMEKVDGQLLYDHLKQLSDKQLEKAIQQFVLALITLHEIPLSKSTFQTLSYPTGRCEYAKQQALEGRMYAKNQNLFSAIEWLERNADNCPCDRYSLVRCDMNFKNFILTDSHRIVFVDWEFPQIGDILKDVAFAYFSLRHLFGVRGINRKGAFLAEMFLKEYNKKSPRLLDAFALRFYLVSACLREAIMLEAQTKAMRNPLHTAKTFGICYAVLAPLVAFHFRQRYMATFFCLEKLASID